MMKKYLFQFLITVTLFSCDNNDELQLNTDLIGDWNLIEVYADPGGGGSFIPVESEKQITFHEDGSISSNGDLCSMSIEVNNPSSGTYNLSDSTFTSADCNNPTYKYRFNQNENILIIHYPCIEPCQAKYQKE